MTDPERTFDASYWRTTHEVLDGVEFADAFYERFLSASDAVRAKFAKTDFERQKKVLMTSLAFMSSFSASGVPNVVVEKIAESHSRGGLDIAPPLYDLWLECLVDTVREFDREFSPDVEAAWRGTLRPGIEYMKAHWET
jgi:hemoglobin-like flavoprotein